MSKIIIEVKKDQCCICHEILDANISVLPCFHQIHSKCMFALIHYESNDLKCPLCRNPVCDENKERDIESILCEEKKIENIATCQYNAYRNIVYNNNKKAIQEFIATKNVKCLYKPELIYNAMEFGLDILIKIAVKEDLIYLYNVLTKDKLYYWHLNVLILIESRNLVNIDYIHIWETSFLCSDEKFFKYILSKPSVIEHIKSNKNKYKLVGYAKQYYNQATNKKCIIM